MLLAVRILSYGCTWKVWRALKKLELLLALPRATLTHLSCSPNFPRASITRYTHAKHEQILKFCIPIETDKNLWKIGRLRTRKGTLLQLQCRKNFASQRQTAFLYQFCLPTRLRVFLTFNKALSFVFGSIQSPYTACFGMYYFRK